MKRALVLLLVAFAACADPEAPARLATYTFDLNGGIFHWPVNRLPVRFFADTRGNMRQLIARAIHSWESQLLYGEFRGVLVDDSTTADVIVTWGVDSVPPDVPPDSGPPVFSCFGNTRFHLDSTLTALDSVIRVDLDVRVGQIFTENQVAACMRRIAIHELGHALGLGQHSPYSGDLMWANDTAAVPSPSDRRTVEILYHTTPTIGPPPP